MTSSRKSRRAPGSIPGSGRYVFVFGVFLKWVGGFVGAMAMVGVIFGWRWDGKRGESGPWDEKAAEVGMKHLIRPKLMLYLRFQILLRC